MKYSQFASISLVNQSIKNTREVLDQYEKEFIPEISARCYVPKHIRDQIKRLTNLENIRANIIQSRQQLNQK